MSWASHASWCNLDVSRDEPRQLRRHRIARKCIRAIASGAHRERQKQFEAPLLRDGGLALTRRWAEMRAFQRHAARRRRRRWASSLDRGGDGGAVLV